MRVVVDTHEGGCIVGELCELGADVDVRSLGVGDYVVGRSCGVERKTVRDLHLSLVEGRLWPQLGRLRSTFRWRYLFVEGGDIDAGPAGAAAIRGAILAAMEQGIRVVRTVDVADTASWLYRLAYRCQHRRQADRPPYAQRPAPRKSADAAEAMLAAVPGVSTYTARALLEHFGSVAAVVASSPDEWQVVRGVGQRRAAALATVLRLPQPPAAEAPGPST